MDLQVLDNFHCDLLKKVQSNFPKIQKATENFNKSQSQFMDNMLTIHQLTPLRSARQCLAEIKKIKLAIEESFFKVKKNEIVIESKVSESRRTQQLLVSQLLDLEIEELKTQNKNIIENVNGAVRKLSGFMTQYENILKKYGKEEFTEEDFEKDEERYHIMKAFEQGLNAARARGGIIDEGNLIYLFQIGISGTAAQIEVQTYFKREDTLIKDGELPSHQFQLNWLEKMADKYSGSAKRFAKYKGVSLIDNESLITRSIKDGEL